MGLRGEKPTKPEINKNKERSVKEKMESHLFTYSVHCHYHISIVAIAPVLDVLFKL